MNKAIQDCEANIATLTDDLHFIAEDIRAATCPEQLEKLLKHRALSQMARQSEYDKLRRLQSEQAIIDAGGD